MPAVVVSRIEEDPEFEGKITIFVIICAIVAAFGGLMFGYDIGISGGVASTNDFLEKFFPRVYQRKKHVHEDNYCKYDDQFLQLFTSSLYIAALVASLLASKICSKYGRRITMQLSGLLAIVGALLTALATNTAMAIIGRVVLGLGVGFGNQAVPLFLSELAPTKLRGALNVCFQLFVTIGILVANIANYFILKIRPNGWRISLGIAAIPAGVLFIGSLIICETPTSLIERGKVEQGMTVLKRIRGTQNVEPEYNSIVMACEMAKEVKHPYRELMKPPSRPPLVIGIMLQVFQQFTGINAIMFYAPILLQTVGLGSDGALLSAVIVGSVNVVSTVVSNFLVDKAGRKVLLLEASVQMLISMIIIGIILIHDLKPTGALKKREAIVVVVFLCTFVMSFAWSWGPMGWLIPSETFPIQTRAAGFAIAVGFNMLFTFLIAQAFLTMLCIMKAGIFFFFAAWIVVMGIFTMFLIPETKGVPVDSMAQRVWKQHWLWKRYMIDERARDVEMNGRRH